MSSPSKDRTPAFRLLRLTGPLDEFCRKRGNWGFNAVFAIYLNQNPEHRSDWPEADLKFGQINVLC